MEIVGVAYSDFAWEGSPLSSLCWPAAASLAYVSFSAVLARRVSAGRAPASPVWLSAAVRVHNVILILASAAMFLGTAVEVWKRSTVEGALGFVACTDPASERPVGGLYLWSYLYYLSKYYELLDTPLQLLRGKLPPNFGFQVYHHALVLFMAWAWLQYTPPLWQVGLLLNTAVHVVMYLYFLLCALGSPPKWKRFVTYFQIFQFAISLLCFALSCSLVASGRECAGFPTMLASTAFNVTLLWQFVGIARKGGRGKREAAVANGKSKPE